MAQWLDNDGDRWADDPRLAVFRPEEWPAAPGEVVESCRCSSCRERWGPPKPAGNTWSEARRRWRRARRAVLVRGSPAYRVEVLAALREGTEDSRMDTYMPRLAERHNP